MLKEIKQSADYLQQYYSSWLYAHNFINAPISRPIIYFNLTSNCNLNCQMCSCRTLKNKERSEKQLSYWLDLLRQLDNVYDSYKLVLIGGEPLLFKGFQTLLSATSNKAIVDLCTNGTLVDREIARLICEKANILHLSLDGLEKSHNYIRHNSKAFQKTINCINLINEIGNEIGKKPVIKISTTINHYSCRELPVLVKLLKNFNVKFDFLLLGTRNSASATSGELWLNDKDIEDLKKSLMQVSLLKLTGAGIENSITWLNNIPKHYTNELHNKYLFCPLAEKCMSFDPYGDLYYCERHKPVATMDSGITIQEILTNEKYLKIRKHQTNCSRDCNEHCHYYHDFKDSILRYNSDCISKLSRIVFNKKKN